MERDLNPCKKVEKWYAQPSAVISYIKELAFSRDQVQN